MHCSNCGTLLTQNLNYCQHCGSRNRQSAMMNGQSHASLFICAAGAIGVVGLIAFYPILRELLHSQIQPEVMAILVIAYLLTLLLMFSVLVGFGWKRSGDTHVKTNIRSDDHDYAPPPALRGANTAQLEPATAHPASVTEHTTRTLEPNLRTGTSGDRRI